MIAIVQRVTEATVVVASKAVGQIGPGMVVLAAVHADDSRQDIDWMVNKIAGLRIFRSGDKHFELDVRQAGGSILLVSNFTVAGQTRKGRRPSLDQAAPPAMAEGQFRQFVKAMRETGIPTQMGVFGGDMQVSLVNDGPVTFILDSREARGGAQNESPPRA